MIKHASALHFHISEHIGERGYSASIEEFHHHLDNKIGNFVLLNEMLNSVSVLGDPDLYQQFQTATDSISNVILSVAKNLIDS